MKKRTLLAVLSERPGRHIEGVIEILLCHISFELRAGPTLSAGTHGPSLCAVCWLATCMAGPAQNDFRLVMCMVGPARMDLVYGWSCTKSVLFV